MLIRPTKIQVDWLLVQEKRKIDFQFGMILATFDLDITLILSTKFHVN